MKKISLALQGGGSHGAFAWGVIDKILEDGRLFIEGVSGASAGGMNAVAYLQGYAENGPQGARDKLRQFWKTLSEVSLLSPYRGTLADQIEGRFGLEDSPAAAIMHRVVKTFSPYQWNPTNFNLLRFVIQRVFDFKKIKSFTGAQVFLCATHVATGKLKIFTNQDLSSEALLASACMPTLYQAVEVEGEFYWDGGYVGNPALFPLIGGCETADILIVQLARQNQTTLPTSRAQIEDRMREINLNLSLLRELRVISFITRLIDQGKVKENALKRLHIHLIRSAEIGHDLASSSFLNSQWQFIEFLFQWGRKMTEEWLGCHFQDIGCRSSANIEKEFVS